MCCLNNLTSVLYCPHSRCVLFILTHSLYIQWLLSSPSLCVVQHIPVVEPSPHGLVPISHQVPGQGQGQGAVAASSGSFLPSIHTKPYHMTSAAAAGHSHAPSGYTSIAPSNKSTAHNSFLPSIYGDKYSAKVSKHRIQVVDTTYFCIEKSHHKCASMYRFFLCQSTSNLIMNELFNNWPFTCQNSLYHIILSQMWLFLWWPFTMSDFYNLFMLLCCSMHCILVSLPSPSTTASPLQHITRHTPHTFPPSPNTEQEQDNNDVQ